MKTLVGQLTAQNLPDPSVLLAQTATTKPPTAFPLRREAIKGWWPCHHVLRWGALWPLPPLTRAPPHHREPLVMSQKPSTSQRPQLTTSHGELGLQVNLRRTQHQPTARHTSRECDVPRTVDKLVTSGWLTHSHATPAQTPKAAPLSAEPVPSCPCGRDHPQTVCLSPAPARGDK